MPEEVQKKIAKKKKTTKTSIDNNLLTKNRTWKEFLENDSYLIFPEKLDWRNRFCLTLLTWASGDDALEIVDFVTEMRMSRTTLYEWTKTYPDIKKAFDQAKLMIGSRKRKGALTRKYEKDVAYRDMHILDPEYLEINKYYADLKKSEEVQPTTFIINTNKPIVETKEDMEAQINKIGKE